MDNPLLEKARAHFTGLALESLHVPEWDLTVHWKPWTVAESTRRDKMLNKDGATHDLAVRIIIMKALDANGKPLFSLMDLPEFQHGLDPGVVLRISKAIVGNDAREFDAEVETKNSETIPTGS